MSVWFIWSHLRKPRTVVYAIVSFNAELKISFFGHVIRKRSFNRVDLCQCSKTGPISWDNWIIMENLKMHVWFNLITPTPVGEDSYSSYLFTCSQASLLLIWRGLIWIVSLTETHRAVFCPCKTLIEIWCIVGTPWSDTPALWWHGNSLLFSWVDGILVIVR